LQTSAVTIGVHRTAGPFYVPILLFVSCPWSNPPLVVTRTSVRGRETFHVSLCPLFTALTSPVRSLPASASDYTPVPCMLPLWSFSCFLNPTLAPKRISPSKPPACASAIQSFFFFPPPPCQTESLEGSILFDRTLCGPVRSTSFT